MIASKPISTEEIRSALGDYGFQADGEYCARVVAYVELLLRWNRKMSLTAVTEPLEVVKFHFGESLVGIAAAGIENGRLADLGSGAGFPGLPIAMAKPGLQATLIESNARKAVFLAEVRRELALANVTIRRGRFEGFSDGGGFDFLTARALGEHKEVLKWSADHLESGGRSVLWVGSEALAEIECVSGWEWNDPVRIPGTNDRFVAVGRVRRAV
ncbi:MAG TPA: 16S rRNA (guanine(527)-N(7))-methyltransferase RsmG [Candidatus Acidoferrales bacterium]|nr:16S rRNA (guanine(527)-N(7))-methyltransferase RsmG [Candidatus Acidoferrales bacterium]